LREEQGVCEDLFFGVIHLHTMLQLPTRHSLIFEAPSA
jgi:hypothetical protein